MFGGSFNMILFWAILIVLMCVAEAATTALVSLWFVGGGLAALALAVFKFPVWLQILVFLVVSAFLFATCREWLASHFHPRHMETNTGRLIGAIGTVTTPIIPNQGGRILVAGQDWKAQSINNELIEKGELVKVTDLKGVRLIVMHVPKQS